MGKNILIISIEKDPYSTTFIKAHIDLLKGNKIHMYGGFFPTHIADQGLLVKPSLWKSIYQKVVKTFLNVDIKLKYYKENVLLNFILKNKIDLVLAEFGPVGAEVFKVCRKAKVPLIVHFHGFDAYADYVLTKYRDPYLQMFKYASKLIVVSKDMEDQLKLLGATSDKIVYNCCGPADDFFDLEPDFQELHFVAVGRFVDKKAPYLTLVAFNKLQSVFPNARLTMAGEGPLLFTCKNLAKLWNISDKVNFAGAVSHEKVRALYSSAYCFLQHSIVGDNGDSEGTPVGILEAGAAGIPIIATKHAGIKDVVLHGKTGFLVDEGDAEGMGDYMIQLSQQATLAREMGLSGRKRILEHFSLKRHIDVLDQEIESAIYGKANKNKVLENKPSLAYDERIQGK